MTRKEIRGAEFIQCPHCVLPTHRQGAQDECDVYRCAAGHIARLRIGHGTPDRGSDVCSICQGDGRVARESVADNAEVDVDICSSCDGTGWSF